MLAIDENRWSPNWKWCVWILILTVMLLEWERVFSRQSVGEVGKLVFFNTLFQERSQVTVTDLSSLGAFVNQVIKGCHPVIGLFRHM